MTQKFNVQNCVPDSLFHPVQVLVLIRFCRRHLGFVLSPYAFPKLYKLFRVSSMAVLGSTMMEGEDGALIDLIKKEKVSLPVLMEE